MYTIISDLHLGMKRTTGVTVQSSAAFYEFQLKHFKQMLEAHPGNDLIILGDLFASSTVPYTVVWDALRILQGFPHDIILVRANHDISKDRTQMAGFDFLCKLLPKAIAVTEPYALNNVAMIIPHAANQTIFDQQIEAAAETYQVLLTHANFDNHFAQASDHSLDFTADQAKAFERIISGHEHNARTVGNVHMLGAQWPCSIAEVTPKFYHIWDGGYELEAIPSPAKFEYVEADWSDLDGIPTSANFVRVTGVATAEQAGQVIDQVNRYRQTSSAFYITNSVKIGEIDLGDIENVTEETLSGFDPVQALLELLPEAHSTRLRGMLI